MWHTGNRAISISLLTFAAVDGCSSIDGFRGNAPVFFPPPSPPGPALLQRRGDGQAEWHDSLSTKRLQPAAFCMRHQVAFKTWLRAAANAKQGWMDGYQRLKDAWTRDQTASAPEAINKTSWDLAPEESLHWCKLQHFPPISPPASISIHGIRCQMKVTVLPAHILLQYIYISILNWRLGEMPNAMWCRLGVFLGKCKLGLTLKI